MTQKVKILICFKDAIVAGADPSHNFRIPGGKKRAYEWLRKLPVYQSTAWQLGELLFFGIKGKILLSGKLVEECFPLDHNMPKRKFFKTFIENLRENGFLELAEIVEKLHKRKKLKLI